jgi:antitoxin (DNA-binding transcriptional repressor) of toxin-antitoxin stability system
MKTVPVRELSQNGASKVIAAAEHEPVLVTKNNEPAVWMVGAREVALVSEQLTGDQSVYRGALAVVAVDLYSRSILSIGRAARLAGIPLAEFILLCGKLQIPVLNEPPGGLEAEFAGLEAALQGERPAPMHDGGLPETAPVPHGDRQSVRVSALVKRDNGRKSSLPEANDEDYLVAAANLVV